MPSLSITQRINLALASVIGIALISLYVLASQTQRSRLEQLDVYSAIVEQQLLTREIQNNFKKQVQEWKNILLRGTDKDDMELYLGKFQSMESQVASGLDRLLATGLASPAAALATDVQAQLSQLAAKYREALTIYESADSNGYMLADSHVRGADRSPTDQLDELMLMITAEVGSSLASSDAEAKSNLLQTILIVGALFVGIGIYIATFMSRRLARPLKELSNCAHEIADVHDMSPIPYTERQDEIGFLADSLQSLKRQRITAMAMQRSAKLAIEFEESEKRALLEAEIETQKNNVASQAQKYDDELAKASADRDFQLANRVTRLSQAVAAAASGDLKYLAAHPEKGTRPDDDLGNMTTDLEKLFEQFDQDFGLITLEAKNLSDASVVLSELSGSIKNDAQLNAEQTNQVLACAETVRSSITKVSEDMGSMARDISAIEGNAKKASSVANEAVDLGQRTDATMRKLSISSADIGNVIKLINSVAEQTNLLALNATIEAARAGDAGKGFAVVANEVKELAKETNKATEEIQRRIDAIRTDTDQAVDAIGSINDIVSQINEIQVGITDLVQVQSHSADGIIGLVTTMLTGNKKVRKLISEVSERQQGAQESAVKIHDASINLKKTASESLELTARYAP